MKNAIKILLSALSWVLVAPLAYPVAWLGPMDGRDLIFQLGSHTMSLVPGIVGVYLRRQYYRITLGLKSQGFVIEFGAILAQRGIEIGNFTYVGPFCNVGLCALGNDVLLGSNVDIVSGKQTHYCERVDVPIREQGGVLKKVRIGNDCWIGNKSVVLVDVAEGTVVGAGSVVVAEFPPRSIIVGNPARWIRDRAAAAEEKTSSGASGATL